MKAEYQGRSSMRVRSFALFGDTTGEVDSFGLPVRHRWAQDYRGKALVVFGHTPVPEPDRLNNTINIDTGCCFGGASPPSATPRTRPSPSPRTRSTPSPRGRSSTPRSRGEALDTRSGDDLLRIEDVTGKRIVSTAFMGTLTIRAEQAGPALEVLSRFAADPRWLVYLPPTMAPCPASPSGPYLEHPARGVPAVPPGRRDHRRLPGETHGLASGCRRDARPRGRRPSLPARRPGPGRDPHPDRPEVLRRSTAVEASMLDRVAAATTARASGTSWRRDWAVLDAELMPWSAKAAGPAERPVRARRSRRSADPSMLVEALSQAASRGVELGELVAEARERLGEIEGLHHRLWALLLADRGSRRASSSRRSTFWRRELDLLRPRPRLAHEHPGPARRGRPRLDRRHPLEARQSADEADRKRATAWWVERTEAGHGRDGRQAAGFRRQEPQGLIQPAVKVRGRNYLRIIYGPEYLLPANLERLRSRALGRKRSLALREFALGARPWNASPETNRSTGSTSASPGSSPGIRAGRPEALTRIVPRSVLAAPEGRPSVAQGETLGNRPIEPRISSPGRATVRLRSRRTVALPGLDDSWSPIESPGFHPGLLTVAPPGLQIRKKAGPTSQSRRSTRHGRTSLPASLNRLRKGRRRRGRAYAPRSGRG